jgi:excisionase family DNA binding protein
MEKLLKVREVAARLGVSRQTVSKYIRDGQLKAQELGPRSTRIAESEIDRFLAEMESKCQK